MVKVTAGRLVFAMFSLGVTLFGVLVIITLVETIRTNMAYLVMSPTLGLSVLWASLILIFAGMFISRLAIDPIHGRRSPIKGMSALWVLFCITFLSDAFLFHYNGGTFYYLKVGLESIAFIAFCVLGAMNLRGLRKKYYVVGP